MTLLGSHTVCLDWYMREQAVAIFYFLLSSCHFLFAVLQTSLSDWCSMMQLTLHGPVDLTDSLSHVLPEVAQLSHVRFPSPCFADFESAAWTI